MIEVRVEDLAFYSGHAVIRPATATLGATTALLRRFELAGGRALLDQLKVAEPLPVGSAVVTGAGDLPVELLVHAIVTFRDGSSVLQAARPDMRLPIQLAISWPERWDEAVPTLDPEALRGLEFSPIAAGRFPAFDLARAAGETGGTAPCVLNAADEVAVQAFLDGEIALGEVVDRVAEVLERHRPEPVESLAQLEAVDAGARAAARAAVLAR